MDVICNSGVFILALCVERWFDVIEVVIVDDGVFLVYWIMQCVCVCIVLMVVQVVLVQCGMCVCQFEQFVGGVDGDFGGEYFGFGCQDLCMCYVFGIGGGDGCIDGVVCVFQQCFVGMQVDLQVVYGLDGIWIFLGVIVLVVDLWV